MEQGGELYGKWLKHVNDIQTCQYPYVRTLQEEVCLENVDLSLVA